MIVRGLGKIRLVPSSDWSHPKIGQEKEERRRGKVGLIRTKHRFPSLK